MHGLEGKDVLQISLFGEQEADFAALQKVQLPGFRIDDFQNPVVAKFLKSYQTKYGKQTIEKILNRAQIYLPLIHETFSKLDIPLDLSYLPVIESGFYAHAQSSMGALGLWQFMKNTAKHYRLTDSFWHDDRKDVVKSTRAVAFHLRWLFKRFDDWLLALAAYNAGEGKIARALKKTNTKTFWELAQTDAIKKETKDYVPKFIAASLVAKNPQIYGISLNPPTISTKQLQSVSVEDATELSILAQCAGLTLAEFKEINPALKKWITPPSELFVIHIPKEIVSSFLQQINKIPRDKRVTYRRYKIKMGDNLSSIAKNFQVPTSPIAQINNIKNVQNIRAGEYILIPVQGLDKAKANDISSSAITIASTKPKKKYVIHPDWKSFFHEVNEGDSAYSIAKQYNVSLEQISDWNNFSSLKNIQIGSLITIVITPQAR